MTQVALMPQIAGQLESVQANVGEPVRKGQLLAAVDDSQLEVSVAQAQANVAAAQAGIQAAQAQRAAAHDQVLVADQAVAQAKAAVLQAEAGLSKARIQARLRDSLLRRTEEIAAKELVSRQAVDEAAADAESALADQRYAEAQLESVRGQLKQARLRSSAALDQERASQAQLRTAQEQARSQASALAAVQLRQRQTRLVSPIDGVVIARPLDPGSYVSPSGGKPVLVLASLKGLRVSFQLTETDLELVKPGQTAELTFDALPRVRSQGRVQRLAGGLDPSTRTMRVEVVLPKPAAGLKPGMLARLRIRGQASEVLTVPGEAIISDGAHHYAWMVDAHNQVHRQEVEIEELQGTDVVVRSGLKTSDTVVVRGVDLISEGVTVTPAQVTP